MGLAHLALMGEPPLELPNLLIACAKRTVDNLKNELFESNSHEVIASYSELARSRRDLNPESMGDDRELLNASD